MTLWAAVLAQSAHPEPVSAVDGRGRRVMLPSPPRRIVSLAPSTTEILFAIGAGPRVVGVTQFCDFPPPARRLPKVGDYSTSAEKVIALRPELVVGGVAANRAAVANLERLLKGHGAVFAVEPQTIPELLTAIESIGRICAAPKARAVTADIRARLARVRNRIARKPKPSVLFVIQREPLWVAGSGNFMDAMIEAAGGSNAARPLGAGYRTMALERAIGLNPDVILTTHNGLPAFRNRRGWSVMRAVRSGRVYLVGYETVRPGPRIAAAVEQLANILHPRTSVPPGSRPSPAP